MTRRIKRFATPKTWKIEKKTKKWTVSTSNGPHSVEKSIPLVLALRNILKLSKTSREARKSIGEGKILVDGKIVKDFRYPLGLMDVVAIPSIEKYYRVLTDPQGKIELFEIPKEKSEWKLCRINNKTVVKGGFTQLNLHDGRNIIVQRQYETKDVLKITLPSQKIIDHYPFEPGKICMITGGKHSGELVTLEKYVTVRGPNPNVVYFKEGISTMEDYVFVIGNKLPEIVVPEGRKNEE